MAFLAWHFRNPEALFLLLLIPLFVVHHLRSLKRQKVTIKFPALALARKAQSSWMLRLRRWLPALRWIAFAFFIVALARPQSRQKMEQTSTEGVDIMLALDVSGTMDFLDMLGGVEQAKLGVMSADKMFRSGEYKQYSRLGYAKKVIETFIEKRADDRMGLTVFASGAFTQCPLTTDHGVLVELLRGVNDSTLGEGRGTAIGDGLMDALIRLRDTKAKSKIVVLLTDGANNSGSIQPQMAAEVAKALGIKVYTIGVGKKNGSFLWFQQNPFTGELGWSEVAIPPDGGIDEPLLKNIAKMTGGQFYTAKNPKELEEIYNNIDKLEKTEIESWSYARYTEEFYPLLLLGALFLLLELVLMNTRFVRVP
jgi:Ca-activated chloride channel family protein